MADDVAALLDHLQAAGTAPAGGAYVLGLSLGGCVAQALAARRPDLVRALVLVNTFARLRPAGQTDVGRSLVQLAAMLKHASLVMVFSDLLAEPEPIVSALRRLRHGGNDVILFHILDEAEVKFPFSGLVELEEPETHSRLEVDADSYRRDYLQEIDEFRETYRRECFQSGIDYVALDTSMPFDRALMEYLLMRQSRG